MCHTPHSTLHTRSISAFTLIEISIVLVIIGLIVGGVMVGRDLIESSRIRSQINQIEQFKTAANSFKLKYGYLPGDIPPTETAQLGFFTFTGTYAGQEYRLANSYRYGFGDNSSDIQEGEWYVFWQHLSEARMIEGTYGGSPSGSNYLRTSTNTYNVGGTPLATPGNIRGWDIFKPQSKFSHAGNHIDVIAVRYFATDPSYRETSLLNTFRFYVTPNQEFAIDSKIDDGIPDKGQIRDYGTRFSWAGVQPCVTAIWNGSDYNQTYTTTPATADTPDACQLSILW